MAERVNKDKPLPQLEAPGNRVYMNMFLGHCLWNNTCKGAGHGRGGFKLWWGSRTGVVAQNLEVSKPGIRGF